MNKKTIATLCLALVALTAIPGSQAADLPAAIKINCDVEFVAVAETSADTKSGGCGGGSGGCTTDFAAAQGGTTGTYLNRAINDPISVANVIDWHWDLAFGTVGNAGAYASCVL